MLVFRVMLVHRNPFADTAQHHRKRSLNGADLVWDARPEHESDRYCCESIHPMGSALSPRAGSKMSVEAVPVAGGSHLAGAHLWLT